MNKSLATPTRLHPAYAHGNAMPVTNLALLSQIHLSDESGCRSFAPNPFKPNICASCSRLINKHAPEAIPSDDALLRAIEYSQKGEKVPSCILRRSRDGCVWGGLYHGGFKAVMNTPFLKEEGVTHIVNTAKGLEIFGPKYLEAVGRARTELGISVLDLGWEDTTSFAIPEEDLARSAKFIHAARAAGGSVLVHCAQGKSRSAVAVTSYLMASQRLSYEEALALVQEQRKMAEPNPAFEAALRQYQTSEALQHLQAQLTTSAAAADQ